MPDCDTKEALNAIISVTRLAIVAAEARLSRFGLDDKMPLILDRIGSNIVLIRQLFVDYESEKKEMS